MDGVIYEDSPLAAYLEAEGTGDDKWIPAQEDKPIGQSPEVPSFAPQGQSTLQAKIRERLRKPLRIQIPNRGPMSRIHHACSRAVNSRLGSADNARFLEHFRYILITSQLLDEQNGVNLAKKPTSLNDMDVPARYIDGNVGPVSLIGLIYTGAAAFAVAAFLHWAINSRPSEMLKGRGLVVIGVFVVAAALIYGYFRRQWLHTLRQQAVDDATVLVTNLQALQTSTVSALTLIQEVELVSRGYRLSSPLPPVSRLDEKGQSRRCARLRKSLHTSFATLIAPFQNTCRSLKPLVDEDSVEKYLDTYEVHNIDIEDSSRDYSDAEFEDMQALKSLRILHLRITTLQRVLICSLLSLEADGGTEDFQRWAIVVDLMRQLAKISGDMSEKINSILGEEDHFVMPPTPKAPSTPGRERMRGQIRKLASLSQGIRGLQAKMQILREESNKTLEDSADFTELSSGLMAQYDSIGADLKSLVQSWEAGKASLALNIEKNDRRVSQASSGLRSPAPSLGGLTAVDEGTPIDALRALNGELASPAFGDSSEKFSSGSASDEEIFEAIAIPRRRMTMTREERQAKILEDRARQASAREQREASSNMIHELKSVITLKKPPNGRISSI